MTVDRAVAERGAHHGATQRAKVFIYANDPISQAGVASQLRPRPEVQLVDAAELDQADVAVVVTESVDEEVLRVLRERGHVREPRAKPGDSEDRRGEKRRDDRRCVVRLDGGLGDGR